MTYRPRPSREALALAAVDLALSPDLALLLEQELTSAEERATLLTALLEALGVPADDVELLATVGPDTTYSTTYSRDELADDLVACALILDEADTQHADGDLLRAASRPDATLAQREAELEYVRRRFDDLVRAAVESLPPATIDRP